MITITYYRGNSDNRDNDIPIYNLKTMWLYKIIVRQIFVWIPTAIHSKVMMLINISCRQNFVSLRYFVFTFFNSSDASSQLLNIETLYIITANEYIWKGIHAL